ncbi:anaerobic ribonucleoside-triphosphate reductase activating protein [Hippea alviniae]|uniref:anaerobic ribonucleoside-triphosphate reductase activating protein n=1 Tax=Hippea alviniae TaxID=1279027 RepID=UPI0003B4456B|nr:anaerobic ribonucleoside-triphosphate reductase activating protein [Hippea alviniae]
MFGGLQRFSLIDYPKEIAAVVFTIGCNFRCPYCHNPELVNNTAERIEDKYILDFLEKRVGKLTAVSITGGEPTIHGERLIKFIEQVKDKGFKVKLDTNGSNPKLLNKLISLNLIDYIAMDIKAPFEKYEKVAGVKCNTDKISESINIILNFKNHEFRTTVVEELLNENDIEEILNLIKGAKLYVIQNFKPSKTLNPDFINRKGFPERKLLKLKETAKGHVKKCIIR